MSYLKLILLVCLVIYFPSDLIFSTRYNIAYGDQTQDESIFIEPFTFDKKNKKLMTNAYHSQHHTLNGESFSKILEEIEHNVCFESEGADTQNNDSSNAPDNSYLEAAICNDCQKKTADKHIIPTQINEAVAKDKNKLTKKAAIARELQSFNLNLCPVNEVGNLKYQEEELHQYKANINLYSKELAQLKQNLPTDLDLLKALDNLKSDPPLSENRSALAKCLAQENSQYDSEIQNIKEYINHVKNQITQYGKSPNKTYKSDQVALLKGELTSVQSSLNEINLRINANSISDPTLWNHDKSLSAKAKMKLDLCRNRTKELIEQANQQIPLYEHEIESMRTIITEKEKRIQELKNTNAHQNKKTPESKLLTFQKFASIKYEPVQRNPGYKNCSLTPTELFTLACYTANGYTDLNYNLRTGGKKALAMKPFVETLNLALGKLKPYSGTVYRRTNLPPEILEMHQVGSIVTYPAFTSTSLSTAYSVTNDGQSFIIYSKNGRYVGSHSSNYLEAEVLFKANTRFKVLSREVVSDTVQFVLEEVE